MGSSSCSESRSSGAHNQRTRKTSKVHGKHTRKRKRSKKPHRSSDDSDGRSVKRHRVHKHRDHRKQKSRKRSKSKRSARHESCRSDSISQADYYRRINEFKEWLVEFKSLYFDKLDGERARTLFSKFVKRWNRNRLPEKYYLGQTSCATRSSFNWKFSDCANSQLSLVKKDVKQDSSSRMFTQKQEIAEPHVIIGPTLPKRHKEDALDEEELELYNQAVKHKKDKTFKEWKNLVHEELLPKKEGRERQMEKKRSLTRYHRSKDDSPEHDEDQVMGGGEDFEKRLAVERAKKSELAQNRYKEYLTRLKTYRESEEQKLKAFKEMVNAGNFVRL